MGPTALAQRVNNATRQGGPAVAQGYNPLYEHEFNQHPLN
jgi:hypothetical protein